MYKTITKELSKCELIDIMMGMDCEEDMCTHTSIQRVLCPIQACDEFGGDPEDSRPLLPGTYLAVYHDKMEDEPFPMFAKICANIITDEDKCQMLMNGDGCILISCSTSTSSQKCAQAFSWAYYVGPLNKLNYARQKITEEF